MRYVDSGAVELSASRSTKPGAMTRPGTWRAACPIGGLPNRNLPESSIPTSIVRQRPSEKTWPPRSTTGGNPVAVAAFRRAHAGHDAPAAASGIIRSRNVRRVIRVGSNRRITGWRGERHNSPTSAPSATRGQTRARRRSAPDPRDKWLSMICSCSRRRD